MIIDNIILWRGNFKIIEEQFSYLSTAGIIIAAALGVLALLAALISPLWFSTVSKILAKHRYTHWLSSSQFGRLLPFACAFLLFPISGLFSTSRLTFWLFLLFGWGAAAIILYCGELFDEWSPKM